MNTMMSPSPQGPRLPDKLSDLIGVALRDLSSCQADPEYEIDMSTWHRPESNGSVCRICLAGSVMARSLGARRDSRLNPAEYDVDTKCKLMALDSMRSGDVQSALFMLGQYAPYHDPQWIEFWSRLDTPAYNPRHPERFDRMMQSMIEELRRVGL
jgi:hypothetical protein